MHTPGAQVSKSMHPAAKMCIQGALQGAPLISNTDIFTFTFEKHKLGENMYYVCSVLCKPASIFFVATVHRKRFST